MLDYERADYMMLVVAMEETVEMLSTQDLSGLAVFWDGCVCWTKGRMGLAMKALLGPEKLAVLSPKSRLARLYMICLLYTSPSPRDVEESRMPSSA